MRYMSIQIPKLKETDQYLIINKPSGLMVHGDGRNTEETLADLLLAAYPAIKEVGEPLTLDDGVVVYRPGIVHRLDRETSGVLVIAKTQEMFSHLKEQFKNRTVQKVYRAIVWGRFKEERGYVNEPIGRSKSDFRKWTVARGARGKVRGAETRYRVISELEIAGKRASYIEVYPKTGRTHQIRVHMKYVQHPIVCDALYGGKLPCSKDLNRLALHAHQLTFTDLDGKEVTTTSPVPDSFEKLLQEVS